MGTDAPRIGVLALQGGVADHAAMLRRLGAEVTEVRAPGALAGLDGLVVPGGESTAVGRLVRRAGLEEPLRAFGRPILGTCAGLNLLARDAEDGVPGQLLLGRIDIDVRRRGYGAQVRSFEAKIALNGGPPFRGVFIRAPKVVRSGPGVETLAELDGDPVLLREGGVLVSAFHPELTGDLRVHSMFVAMLGAAE